MLFLPDLRSAPNGQPAPFVTDLNGKNYHDHAGKATLLDNDDPLR